MASMAFGPNMDIHSGGIDLAFPHHDNELAQSEAYHGVQQWVNYFLHTGHLSIEGQKMSKSLKNFITIKEALQKYTPRQLRLAFLNTAWDGPMDFKDDVMEEMKSLEEKICVWFSKAELILEKVNAGDLAKSAQQDEVAMQKLTERFKETKEAVHNALSDNLNSRAAMTSISDLINDLSKEFKVFNISSTFHLLIEITKWITSILATFGFESSTAAGRLGWAEDRDHILPQIKKAVRYRDSVRAKAVLKQGFDEIDTITRQVEALVGLDTPEFAAYRNGINDFTSAVSNLIKSKAPFADFLKECDRFRDEIMLELGVSIDDTDFGIATIRFADASRLIADRDRKNAADAALAQQKAAEKQRRKEEEERKAREKLEKGKLAPIDMFKTKEYSQWDEEVTKWRNVLMTGFAYPRCRG
jgi:cysteinyl-tRNA synthetase